MVRDRAYSWHDLDDAIDDEENSDGDEMVVVVVLGEDEDEMAVDDDGVLVQSLDFVVPQPQRLVVGKSLRNSMIVVVVAVGVVGIVTEFYYCLVELNCRLRWV